LNKSNYIVKDVEKLLSIYRGKDIFIRWSLRDISSLPLKQNDHATSIISLLCNPATWHRLRYITDGGTFYNCVNKLFTTDNEFNPMLSSSSISAIDFGPKPYEDHASFDSHWNWNFAPHHFDHLDTLVLRGISVTRIPTNIHLPSLRHLELHEIGLLSPVTVSVSPRTMLTGTERCDSDVTGSNDQERKELEKREIKRSI